MRLDSGCLGVVFFHALLDLHRLSVVGVVVLVFSVSRVLSSGLQGRENVCWGLKAARRADPELFSWPIRVRGNFIDVGEEKAI